MEQLPWERLQIAIRAIPAAQAAIDGTVAYVKERKVFGQPIANFQNSRYTLAEMQTEVQIARVVCRQMHRAAVAGQAGHGDGQHSEVLVQ